MGVDINGIKTGIRQNFPAEFFLTLAAVFNPNSYKELSHRSLKRVASFFFSVLFISFFIMILVALPKIIHLNANIQQQLDKFDDFTINLNVSMSNPIYFRPVGFAMDINQDHQPKDENILITNDYLYLREPSSYLNPFSNNYTKLALDDYADLAEKTTELSNLLTAFLIYLLPMLFFTFFVMQLTKFILVAVLFTFIGILLLNITKRRLKAPRIFRAAVYALTPMVIFNTINIPLGYNLLGIPFVASLFYLLIGVTLASEKQFMG